MKRILGLGFIFSFVFCSAFGQPDRPVQPPRGEPPPPIITVQGTGQVSAKPNRANVRFGAEVQTDTASEAQSQVNALMKQALEAIKGMGIEEKNIRTVGLNLHPVYTNQRRSANAEEPRLSGYRASNTLQVQVDDLDLVGKVIDAGIKAGLNRLESLEFQIKEELPHRKQALRSAVSDAREKAMAIAEAMDARLGRVQSVMEGGGGVIPMGPRMGRMAMESTPIQPGELQIEESVTITYEIRER